MAGRGFRNAVWGSALVVALGVAGQASAGQLDVIKKAGKITYCSDLSAPPFLYLDPALKPAGFDVDVGISVAKKLGVEAVYKNITFDGLVPALQAGQCDAILSSLYDKPARRLVVDFVDYSIIGNVVMTRADSTLSVKSLADLSGHRVSAERGSVNEQELQAANADLAKAGKPPIVIISLPKISDTIQQLMSGLVEAIYGGSATVATVNEAKPGSLKVASPQTSAFAAGIATLKANADVHGAIDAAFKATRSDGTYDGIVHKWHFETMAMKP
jgi:polar amino acid transport system substrate-binding protein